MCLHRERETTAWESDCLGLDPASASYSCVSLGTLISLFVFPSPLPPSGDDGNIYLAVLRWVMMYARSLAVSAQHMGETGAIIIDSLLNSF